MSNLSEPITCPSCGTVNTEGKFCISCGSALPAAAPVLYQPTTAPPAAPVYTQPAPVVNHVEAPPQQPVVVVNNIRNYNSKWDYSPIKPWGYFGLNILFAIPLVGFIFLLIFSLGGTKRINLRNYARSFFCGLVLVAVLVIIMIIMWGTLVSQFGDSFNFEWSLF